MISTRLTKRLGIRHPVVQAALGGVACADLVAAVSNAGGLGVLGMIRRSPDFIRDQIRRTRELTSAPFGVSIVPASPPPEGFEAQFEVCLSERVPVLWLFWCDPWTSTPNLRPPARLPEWAIAPKPYVDRCHASGIRVILQIGTAEEARRAVEVGVDIIVAQGFEAGGHVRGQVSLLPLLPVVLDAVSPVPVVAAGGIVDGRGLAAALALGADGVGVGTRFVASEESEAHPDYKKRILGAGETDTAYTEAFHIGWPPHSPHRVLRNPLTEAFGRHKGPWPA